MRIQNNGLGVQSTTIFLMAHEGEIEPIDYSIFADTQEEPQAVYDHLEWLRRIPAPVPIILTGTAGKLGDDLMQGKQSELRRSVRPDHTYARFASIPAYTAAHHEGRRDGCSKGMTRRQCTKEYKIEVVERIIRYIILGMKPRQRMRKGTMIDQVFGISWDERGRAERIRKRFDEIAWSNPVFPLVEKRMTRDDCKAYLKGRVPHEVPRSACVFCPYKTAAEWLRTKQQPKEWARAVEVDEAMRVEGVVLNRNIDQSLYLHRSCLPLEMIDFEAEAAKEAKRKATPLFSLMDCGEGMCGV